MPSEDTIKAIPDYDKLVVEAETFLKRLTDEKFRPSEWSSLWKAINQVSIKLITLEKKWKGYRKATGLAPISMMKKDIDRLVKQLDVVVLESENGVEWGIRSTQSLIDAFPSELDCLKHTDFYSYIHEISELLEEVTSRTRHSEVLKLLREVRKHPDMVVIGQFSTNEMVACYKYLCEERETVDREAILKYLDIYEKLCSIYAKDMVLCYCLLLLRDQGSRPPYAEAQPETRHPQGRINFVVSRTKLFGSGYDLALRNASAHGNVETETRNRVLKIYPGRNKPCKVYSFDKVISLTKEMSALVSAFRLVGIVLANNDWKQIQRILY